MYPNPPPAQQFASGAVHWSRSVFMAGCAAPAGQTVVITPGVSYCWPNPVPSCAGIPPGYSYTFTIGGSTSDGDDGTAGVREPALR